MKKESDRSKEKCVRFTGHSGLRNTTRRTLCTECNVVHSSPIRGSGVCKTGQRGVGQFRAGWGIAQGAGQSAGRGQLGGGGGHDAVLREGTMQGSNKRNQDAENRRVRMQDALYREQRYRRQKPQLHELQRN